jgi:hypothetical protein
VRRSGVRLGEARSYLHLFRSPYRCQDCEARFWVLSRRTRLTASAGGALVLMLAIAFGAPLVWRHSAAQANAGANVHEAVSSPSETNGERRLDDILHAQSEMLDQRAQPRDAQSR